MESKSVCHSVRLHRFDNFEAEGNLVSLAAGANAVLIPERLEFCAAYTTVIASQHKFDANGLIVKMTLG